ncbi:MAG: hypothetical protein CMN76_03415 [Spirochaetaceae bacterium]|nr:hypothetical protein [Spirochaetaceae bacterium]|tara:strand:+ start:129407 stop:130402 length:996 start_codon:yes stop_codon:yes gene_type:complete
MPIWNEKRVQEFVTGLGKGVQGASLEEFLGFLAGVLVSVLLIVWLQRKTHRKKQERDEKRSQRLFDEELDQRALPPSGIELLEDLARAMRNADREAELHRLFHDPFLYDKFANILIEDSPDLRKPLRQLKSILGLGEDLSGQPMQSTEELNSGAPVSVLLRENSVEGTVRNQGRGLEILLRSRFPETPAVRSALTIRWQKKGVSFEADCRVASVREENGDLVLSLEHSSAIRKIHRRQFLRTDCNVAATIANQNVRIINIGGGGFVCSGESSLVFESGLEELSCRIHLDPRIDCTVHRVFESSRGLHFSFVRIRPGDQDRIVRYVISREKS